jgi:hypothetical protein
VKVLPPASSSGIAWMLGMAAAVLVIGAAGGLLILSRGRRRAPRAG